MNFPNHDWIPPPVTIDIAALAAPWIATVFGIAAAIAAERVFRYGKVGSTADRWRGEDLFRTGLGHDEEADESMARDCAREVLRQPGK